MTRQPRKEYVDFEEWETTLIRAGYSEMQFLLETGLGLYTAREWKRVGQAPKWANAYLEMVIKMLDAQGTTPEPYIPKVRDPVLEAMTDAEMQTYYTGTKEQMNQVYNLVRERITS